MLKRKIIKLSSTHTCIIDLAVIMTGISAPLFYLYSCSKLLILFSCLILLSCAYFDYIVTIKLYRYFSHRQVSTTVYRNMSAVHLTTNYSIIFFPFINTFLIIILIMFTNGFIFMVTIYYNTLKSVTTPIDKGISRISFLGKIAKWLPRQALQTNLYQR